MESEKSGFTNKMSEIWRKMQVNILNLQYGYLQGYLNKVGPIRRKSRSPIMERLRESKKIQWKSKKWGRVTFFYGMLTAVWPVCGFFSSLKVLNYEYY